MTDDDHDLAVALDRMRALAQEHGGVLMFRNVEDRAMPVFARATRADDDPCAPIYLWLVGGGDVPFGEVLMLRADDFHNFMRWTAEELT